MRRLTTEEFVDRARRLHGDKFDYSSVTYRDARSKVDVICPKHGLFQQRAHHHLEGVGCPKCGSVARADSLRVDQDEFLRRAKQVHGDRYEYSKAKCTGVGHAVTIICPRHGAFSQVAASHLAGAGCPKCAGNAKLNTREFIRRAVAVHGRRYDYSRAEYRRSDAKVTIVCPKHGPFEQTPANHLQGWGCLRCGWKNAGQYHKKDTRSFIEEARRIHGDRYDYRDTEYRGARETVTIICPRHGAFQQVASEHLRTAGCLACSYTDRGEKARLSFLGFVERAKQVHKGVYDYSRGEKDYAGATSVIAIVCPKHGPFRQSAVNHLTGRGCPRCGKTRAALLMLKSTESFITEAQKVHGQRYDYSKADYAGARRKLTIVCPVDGEFSQTAGSHLHGIGCPKCSRRAQPAPRNLVRALRGEYDHLKGYMYVVRFKMPYTGATLCKVGSGSGNRYKVLLNVLRRAGATDICGTLYEFPTAGEAIVAEHLAQEVVSDRQHVVPDKHRFAGYTEVFEKQPDMNAIEDHPILKLFRAGDRWDPRGAS